MLGPFVYVFFTCTFINVANKWKIFHRPPDVNPDLVNSNTRVAALFTVSDINNKAIRCDDIPLTL